MIFSVRRTSGVCRKGGVLKKIALMGIALALLAGSACAMPVAYRNPADGRAWEVVLDATEPLVWQWADGAMSATVTASNLLSGAVTATTVARGDSQDGSCALPASGDGEQLLDVTLAQTDGTRRAMRGQHCQDNHGLRYYAIASIQLENIDNLSANTYESFRFAIHLRPPQSFGGKWK